MRKMMKKVNEMRQMVMVNAAARMINKIEDMKTEKEPGINGLVVAVILILVAVVAGLAFNEELGDLISDMFTTVDTKMDGMFS